MRVLALLLLAGSAQAGIISGGHTTNTITASSAAATYVNKAGDTMTGRLTAPDATITYGINAATGSFSGSVTVGSGTVDSGFSVLAGHIGLGIRADPTYSFRHRATAGVGLAMHHDGAGALRLGASSDASVWDLNMEFRNAKTTFATGNVIVDAGSVGIGTASPCSTCTLHVAGGASVTGNLELGNGAYIVGGSTGTLWSPAIDCLGGAATGMTSTVTYITVGKTVFFQATVKMTGIGTCTGAVQISTPWTAKDITGFTTTACVGSGRENAQTGNMLQWQQSAGTQVIQIRFFDNTVAAGANYENRISGHCLVN